ncbi:thiamine pyrophosphate-dependent enzyme [Hominifimenecus sp. rT4P-3]|uniref:thiamine pyrophosphate-dependent enzyme n=1 Tax=Hominifimenecus sp. rT4P-3 TaxID=3242979 RepID=UPI003DA2151E
MANVIKEKPSIIHGQHKFCAGCSHGIFYRLIQECVEELGYAKRQIIALGVGCSSNLILNDVDNSDKFQCAHGRAGATATGIKRMRPDVLVMTYQGDGDCGVIGLAETLNAAYRNEKITCFTVNNANFGMTGGQMSWTTLPGQKTTTSIHGRECEQNGWPLHLPEMIAANLKPAYVARCAVYDAKTVAEAKRYIKNALEAQINGEGYSMVELLGVCPTNWGMSPLKATEWLKTELQKEYPLGEFKRRDGQDA